MVKRLRKCRWDRRFVKVSPFNEQSIARPKLMEFWAEFYIISYTELAFAKAHN
jgi:hypothetical protein